MKKNGSLMNKATQVFLPFLTISGFALTALKRPDLGLIFSLSAQVFWLYSGWLAWKKAGQIGIFVTSAIVTVILLFGVINYWFIH
ncbi:MAG TPA: hypothetical protein VLG67_01305 [Candidatus Saccharimonadales bacterium]|nr:hypothetical protein [Candidatus Saccharimonadales bacterium]